MSLVPAILLAPVLLMMADLVRWKVVVGRELKRRGPVRIRAGGIQIPPARSRRLIEISACGRHGKECRVTIVNHGWLRTQPSLEVVEI